MILFRGELLADYHQSYLADDAALDADPDGWTDEDVRARLLPGTGMVSVSTARNMTVPVEVHLHESEPVLDPTDADHVAEATIQTSGRIVMAGLTDDRPTAARVSVLPGPLRVLVELRGMGTLSSDGLDGEDRYAVHLWRGRGPRRHVRKQWVEPGAG